MRGYIRLCIALCLCLLVGAWSIAGLHTPAAPAPTPEEESTVPHTADAQYVLRVLHGGSIERMDMATYLCGVLRAEMPAAFADEALKAQAVAARTYTLYRTQNGEIAAHPDADACDDIQCCKAYRSAENAALLWGDQAANYERKIEAAVLATDGEYILYDNEPILAVFHSSAAGMTQGAGAVWTNDLPYLQSVSSPETAELVPNYYSTVQFSAEEFRAAVRAAIPNTAFGSSTKTYITNIRRNEAGFVTTLSVGGVTVKGNDLRSILDLRSPAFTVETDDDTLTFHVTGYGHGVGMSQYGANILANNGMRYDEILTHYYSGTTIGRQTQ